jgi:dual specificity tyrosine-phosphorylation-regulated kinase 1
MTEAEDKAGKSFLPEDFFEAASTAVVQQKAPTRPPKTIMEIAGTRPRRDRLSPAVFHVRRDRWIGAIQKACSPAASKENEALTMAALARHDKLFGKPDPHSRLTFMAAFWEDGPNAPPLPEVAGEVAGGAGLSNKGERSEVSSIGGGGGGGGGGARARVLRPAHKLSVGLIDTYNCINEVSSQSILVGLPSIWVLSSLFSERYYAKKKSKRGDENYDYKLAPNEMILDRYEVKQRIGKGSFGVVVRAYDHTSEVEVAIKIIKSKKSYMVQAKTEIKILKLLGNTDPQGHSHTIRMLNHFIYRGHQCIIFTMLYCNLYELLRKTNFKGVSLNLICNFGRQILRTLAFLKSLPDPIVHCDLKPENILLCHPRKSAVQVIDFGSSCHLTEKMHSYIQTRFYRAPEVILGSTYGTEIDMWSLGCVLVEMHLGQPLFPGKCSHDQMGKIIEILGLPPTEMVTKAPSKQRRQFFEVIGEPEENVQYRFRPLPATKIKARKGAEGSSVSNADLSEFSPVVVLPRGRHLHVLLGRDAGGPGGRRRGEPNHSPHDYAQFIDLLKAMLTYDPEKRITPLQALRHPFLARNSSTTTPATIARTFAIARTQKRFPHLRLQQEAPRHRSLHPTPCPHRPSHSSPRLPRPHPTADREVQQIAQGVDIGENELGILSELHAICNSESMQFATR